MRIDLHTHSSVSDGTDGPRTLVRHAAEAGIALVRGMEISTALGSASVHLLAYLPDPTHPPLASALAKTLDGRNSRVPAICAKLQSLGMDVTEEAVRRRAADAAATGRPHVADVMVAAGLVVDRDEAFARFLNPGRPAYVHRYAVPLAEAITLVTAAGGVGVIAHPWGRGRSGVLPEARLAELRALGLSGIEVDHQDHAPEARETLRAIARNLDLVVTGSSDHHGIGKANHELGCNTTAPEEYERLLDLAAQAAATSGRSTPAVLA